MTDPSVFSLPYKDSCLRACFLSCGKTPRAVLLYLHGGGFTFGSCRDLPGPYRQMFAAAAYDLILLEYPLAPESGLSQILQAVHALVSAVLTSPKCFGYPEFPPYLLFGRSAGGYLACMETARLCKEAELLPDPVPACASPLPRPAALLCFYSYHSMALPEFMRPAPAYQKLPPVSEETVRALTGTGLLTEGPLQTRYSLYVYGRQTGRWPALLGLDGPEAADLSLQEEDFARMPPGFFTASSGDCDVPFRESKQMAKKIPGSCFHPVYYLPHDFDRDLADPTGAEVYRAAIDWLDAQFAYPAEAGAGALTDPGEMSHA